MVCQHLLILSGPKGYEKASSCIFRMVVQPTMGLGLSANIRMQMNLKVERSALLAKVGGVPLTDDQVHYK